MDKKNITRRKFIAIASAGTASTVAARGINIFGNIDRKASTLAILGGDPIRTKRFPVWPQPNKQIEESLVTTFRSGKWHRFESGAKMVSTFEKKFAELIGTKRCLATGAGTQALHTALYSVGVGAGDEVLVTPCTYISSPQAILLCNALPVFVDVDLDTFQMDPDKMEPLINENTKAIEPVYIAGLPCQMDKIMNIAKKHSLKVVEDACQAHIAEFNGRKCGTFGELGCFSFQSSKVLPCGEGGAVVGNDDELMDRCYAFHNIGQPANKSSIKGSIIGPKYRMTEFEAAVLLPQFDTLEEQVNLRNKNAAYLTNRLNEIPGIIPQKLCKGVNRGTYYLYGFRYKKEYFSDIPRNTFLKALRAEGISNTTMYFDRLNKQHFIEHTLNSKAYQKIYSKERLRRYLEENNCPNNDQLSEEGVWLWQWFLIGTKEDMDDIANAIIKIYENKDKLAKL